MLFFPMEQFMWDRPLAFTGTEQPDYSAIYRKIGEQVIASHPIDAKNNQIGVTLHPTEDGCYAVLVNYDDRVHDAELTVADGWKIQTVYGDPAKIDGCSMAVIRMTK